MATGKEKKQGGLGERRKLLVAQIAFGTQVHVQQKEKELFLKNSL
jgi:hypothetical protein